MKKPYCGKCRIYYSPKEESKWQSYMLNLVLGRLGDVGYVTKESYLEAVNVYIRRTKFCSKKHKTIAKSRVAWIRNQLKTKEEEA